MFSAASNAAENGVFMGYGIMNREVPLKRHFASV
jgi:hypothetical protein